MSLAQHIARATNPLWGVRLHEWDVEYILITRPKLLGFHDDLSERRVPRLIGTMTYFSQELMSKAPLDKVDAIKVSMQVDQLGCFVFVPEEWWAGALAIWSRIVEKQQ